MFNSSMKWKVDDDRLPCTVLHTILYTRQENNTEIMVGECSFTIGEVYIYQPLTTWLNLHDSDEVRSIAYFFFLYLFHLIGTLVFG
jgi:hypothetical protein